MMTFVDGVMVFIKLYGADAAKWKTWALNKYINLTRRANYPTVFTKDYIVPDGRIKIIRAVKEHAYIHIFAEVAEAIGYEFLTSYPIEPHFWACKNPYFDPGAAWADPNFDPNSVPPDDIGVSGRGVRAKLGKNISTPLFDMVDAPSSNSLLRWVQRYNFPNIGDQYNPENLPFRPGTIPAYYVLPFATRLGWNNQKLHQYIHWRYPAASGEYGDDFIISATGVYGGYRANSCASQSMNFMAFDTYFEASDFLMDNEAPLPFVEDYGTDIRAPYYTKESLASNKEAYKSLVILDLNESSNHTYEQDRWWRRHAIQVVKSEDYGSRSFVVGTDNKSRFYVYPLKDYDLGPKLSIDPILWADPPYPDWVNTENKEGVAWVWEFNKTATKAVAICFNSVYPATTSKIIQNFVIAVTAPPEYTVKDIRTDTPGLVEVNINIELTGDNPEDFIFNLSLGRTDFPSTASNRCYLAASYAFGNTNMALLGFDEDDLITLEFDLYHENLTEFKYRHYSYSPSYPPVTFNFLDYVTTIEQAVNSFWADINQPGSRFDVAKDAFTSAGWNTAGWPQAFIDIPTPQPIGFLFKNTPSLRDTRLEGFYNIQGIPKADTTPGKCDYLIKFVANTEDGQIKAEHPISWQTGQWIRGNELASNQSLNLSYGLSGGYAINEDLCAAYTDATADYPTIQVPIPGGPPIDFTGPGYGGYIGMPVHSGCGYSKVLAVDLRSMSFVKVMTKVTQREHQWAWGSTVPIWQPEDPLQPRYNTTMNAFPSTAYKYEIHMWGKKVKEEASEDFTYPALNTEGRSKIPWMYTFYARELAINYFNPALTAFSSHPRGDAGICLGHFWLVDWWPAVGYRWYSETGDGNYTDIPGSAYKKWDIHIDLVRPRSGKLYTHRSLYNAAFKDSRDWDYYLNEMPAYTAGRFATWGVWLGK